MATALARRAPPPGLDKSELRSIFRCSNCKNYINFLRTDKSLLRCINFHYLCATCYWKAENCPLDKCSVGALFPDKNVALPNFWNILKFHCFMSDHGCKAVVPAGQMQEHLKKSCPLRHLLVKCQHGYCNKLMPQSMFLDHITGVHNRQLFPQRTMKLAVKIDFKKPDGPDHTYEPETKVLGTLRYFDTNFLLMAHFYHERQDNAFYIYATKFPEVEREANFKLVVRFQGDTKFEERPVIKYGRDAIDIIEDKLAIKMKTDKCKHFVQDVKGENVNGLFLFVQLGILDVAESVEKMAIFLEEPVAFARKPEPSPARIKPSRGFPEHAPLESEQHPVSVEVNADDKAVEPKSPVQQEKAKKSVSFLGLPTPSSVEPEAPGTFKKAAKEHAPPPQPTTARTQVTAAPYQHIMIKSRPDSKIFQSSSTPAVRLTHPPTNEKSTSKKSRHDKSSAPVTTEAKDSGPPPLSELGNDIGTGERNVLKEEKKKCVRPKLNKSSPVRARELESHMKKANMQIRDDQKSAKVVVPETKPEVTIPKPVLTSEEPITEEKEKPKQEEYPATESSADKKTELLGEQTALPTPDVTVPKEESLNNTGQRDSEDSAADIFANDDQPEREVKQAKTEDVPVPEVQTENFADFSNLELELATPEAYQTEDLAGMKTSAEVIVEQPVVPLPVQSVAATCEPEPALTEVCCGLEIKPETLEDESVRNAVEQEPVVEVAIGSVEQYSANSSAQTAAEISPVVKLECDPVQLDEQPKKQLDSLEDEAGSVKLELDESQNEEILLESSESEPEIKNPDEVKDEPGKVEVVVEIESIPQVSPSPDLEANQCGAELSVDAPPNEKYEENAAKQDKAEYSVIQVEVEVGAQEVHGSFGTIEKVEISECCLQAPANDNSDENAGSYDATEDVKLQLEVKSEPEDIQECTSHAEESVAVLMSVLQASPPETENHTGSAANPEAAKDIPVQDKNEAMTETDDSHDSCPKPITAAAESTLIPSPNENSQEIDAKLGKSSEELEVKVEDSHETQRNNCSITAVEGVADAVDLSSVVNSENVVRPEPESAENDKQHENATLQFKPETMELEQGLDNEVGVVPANKLEDVHEKINAWKARAESSEHEIPIATPTPIENATQLPIIVEGPERNTTKADAEGKEISEIILASSDVPKEEAESTRVSVEREPSQNAGLKTEEPEPVDEVDVAQVRTPEPYLTVETPAEGTSLIRETPRLDLNKAIEDVISDEIKAEVEAPQVLEQPKVEEVSAASETILQTQILNEPCADAPQEVAPALEDSTQKETLAIIKSSILPTEGAESNDRENSANAEKHHIELEGITAEPVTEDPQKTSEIVSSDSNAEFQSAQEAPELLPRENSANAGKHHIELDEGITAEPVSGDQQKTSEIVSSDSNAEVEIAQEAPELLPSTENVSLATFVEPVVEKLKEPLAKVEPEIQQISAADPVVITSNSTEQQELQITEESPTIVLPDVPTNDLEINSEPEIAATSDPEHDEVQNAGQAPSSTLMESPARDETAGPQLPTPPQAINNDDSATNVTVAQAFEDGALSELPVQNLEKTDKEVQGKVEGVVHNMTAETVKSADPETPVESEEALVASGPAKEMKLE